MTLVYFPEIRPDELLYSVLARYHRHAGGKGPGSTAAAAFGSAYAVATYDLPGRLDELAGRIDQRRGLTADRLLDETTLFPYYAAFQPERSQRELRDALRIGAADIHTRIGVVAFRVKRLTALRFCTDCFSEMSSRHGEAYWRRAHQLPGALVCPDHCRPLQESTELSKAGSRHEFIATDARTCPPHARPVCVVDGGRTLDRLVEVARASADLLHTRSGPRDLRELSEEYRERLAQVGLMRSPRRVDHTRLLSLFQEHWGAALAQLPGTLADDGSPGSWLTDIVRLQRKAFHPLYHILLRGFLAASPESARLFRSARASLAFGPGPWPCRNRLADHFGEPVADALSISRNKETTIGTISCRCGCVYWRSLSPDGRMGPPRYRCYGRLLKPALERLAVPGAYLRAVARELGIDRNAVQREAASLCLETPWMYKPSCKPRSETAPKAERVRIASARRRPSPGPRLDWKAIDAELVQLLRQKATEILAVEPPVRVTLAELERRTGRREWLRRRKHKLPLSTGEVEALSESVGDFQRRRARSAARRLSQGGEAPAGWQVMRAAGLRSNGLPLAETELERYLAERHETAPPAALDSRPEAC
jgi:hypothetical protein